MVSMIVTTGEHSAEILQIEDKKRQTKYRSSIKKWYRVTVSTNTFCNAVTTELSSPGPGEIKIWVPQVYFPKRVIPFQRHMKPLRADPLHLESTVGVFTPTPEPAPAPVAESSAMGARHGQPAPAAVPVFVPDDIDREILDDGSNPFTADTSSPLAIVDAPSQASVGSGGKVSVDLDFTMDEDDDENIDAGMAAVMQEYVVDENGVIDLTAGVTGAMDSAGRVVEVVDLTLDDDDG